MITILHIPTGKVCNGVYGDTWADFVNLHEFCNGGIVITDDIFYLWYLDSPRTIKTTLNEFEVINIK